MPPLYTVVIFLCTLQDKTAGTKEYRNFDWFTAKAQAERFINEWKDKPQSNLFKVEVQILSQRTNELAYHYVSTIND